MKKRARALLLFVILFVGITSIAYAHSGRTDSSGGHYNRSTGEYHYHHGYGPHQHPGGVCPYSSAASSSSTTGSVSSSSSSSSAVLSNGDIVVYITPTGEYYHDSDCSYISSKTAVTLQQAVNAGYRACSKCDPPSLATYTDIFEAARERAAAKASAEQKKQAEATPSPKPIATPEPTIEAATKDISNKYNDNMLAAIPLISFGCIPLAMFTYYTYKEKKQRKQQEEEERQRRFEEQRAALVAQYEGKSISELANVPRRYLKKDKTPDIKVCISKNGTKYHKPTCRYARGPRISIEYVGHKSPCGICKPGPCPLWLKEYRRISTEAAQYNIKMLP